MYIVKKNIFSFLFCFSLVFMAMAQKTKHYKVKIFTDDKGLAHLSKQGIALDHGERKKGYSFTSDFSEQELQQIKSSGLSYQILIEDVAAYYVNRNKKVQKNTQLPSSTCLACTQHQQPKNFTLGSMGGFYTYQEMLDVLDSMAKKYPDLITAKQVISADTTYEGRQIFYVKISDNPNVNEAESQVLYTALHHAREPESLSQLIFYMWYLLENYKSNPEIKHLVDNTEMYFVPCVNPDGYVYNQTTDPLGGGMWRKNRVPNDDTTFGVDLNRNYDAEWGYDNTGSSDQTNSNTYRGTAAFSEKETQMMRDFCNAHQFKLALNNHTYGNHIIHPWGYLPSFETPDSSSFIIYGKKMAACNGYNSNTADQTVGYTVNGSSDDWMYGEQISKPKILAYTPESGDASDGFWPAQDRIVPIAQELIEQNLYVARFVNTYAEAKEIGERFISNTASYMKYNMQNLGMQSGTFSVSLKALSSNIQSTGAVKSYSSFTSPLQTQLDSISYTLSSSIASGDVVRFVLTINNGFYSVSDTITKVYGSVVVPFSDNCSTGSYWNTGNWGLSSTEYVSPSESMTDSPDGYYFSNSNETISTLDSVDLSDALAAELSYYAKWDLEKGYDYVEVMAAADGGGYTPLCGKYTHSGGMNEDYMQPLYDGKQSTWVKESIDLSDYIGKKMDLAFILISDHWTERDGFYFDDLVVKKVVNPTSIKENSPLIASVFQNIPNPCSESASIFYNIKDKTQNYVLTLFNSMGQEEISLPLNKKQNNIILNVSQLSSGVYYYRIIGNNIVSEILKMVIVK